MAVPLITRFSFIDERRNITTVDLYNPQIYHKKESKKICGIEPKSHKMIQYPYFFLKVVRMISWYTSFRNLY